MGFPPLPLIKEVGVGDNHKNEQQTWGFFPQPTSHSYPINEKSCFNFNSAAKIIIFITENEINSTSEKLKKKCFK